MPFSATLDYRTFPQTVAGCEVSERLLDIVADSSKSAQQRISEATAYAGTAGWEASSIFALAPDLIRHVELHCGASGDERLMLQILDSEDGQDRLQISYTGAMGEWDRIY